MLLHGGYQLAEQTLARAGRSGAVERSRRELQRALEPRLRAEVEELTGRRVAHVVGAFDSRSQLAAEVFLFEPDH